MAEKLTFIEIYDDREGLEKYWQSFVFNVPNEVCTIKLPRGIVIRRRRLCPGKARFIKLARPIKVTLEERGDTNYDNQRVAHYDGETYLVKVFRGVDKNNIPKKPLKPVTKKHQRWRDAHRRRMEQKK